MKRFIITALITALLLQNVSAPLLSQASEVTEETTTENYNVITVDNVDCVSDQTDELSCYMNVSTGAMKSDVASAGAYVLGYAYSNNSSVQ